MSDKYNRGIGGSVTGGAVYVERWNCVVSLSAAISFSLIWLFWVRSQFDICQALLTFLHELENILKFPHRYKYLNIYTNSHIYTLKCDPQLHDWGNLKRIKMQISFLLLEFPITPIQKLAECKKSEVYIRFKFKQGWGRWMTFPINLADLQLYKLSTSCLSTFISVIKENKHNWVMKTIKL